MLEPEADPAREGRAETRIAVARSLIGSAAWISGGFLAAMAAGVAISALAIGPPEVTAPAAVAIVIGIVLAISPAPGLGLFLLVILTAQTIERWLNLDLRFLDEFAVATIVAVSGVRNWSRIARIRPGWMEIALGLAIAAGITASLVQGVPAETWLPALVLLVKGFAFFYAVSWFALRLVDVERVGAVILAFVFGVLGLGFLEALDPGAFQDALRLPAFSEVRGDVAVVKSIFLHPAIFGWLTAYASLFLYARFIVLRSWWALGGALLLNVGTLLSGRRRPVLGIVGALAVGIVWLWRRRSSPRSMLRIAAPLAGALLVVAILSAPALSDFYLGTVGEYLGAGDLGEILTPAPDPEKVAGAHPRLALYVGSIAIARDHFPLGAGLGRFGSYMSEVHYSPLYTEYGLHRVYGLGPDNPVAISDAFWPMILAELGPIGLVGILAFFAFMVVGLWRSSVTTASAAERAFLLGALFVVIEGLLGSITAPTFVAAPIAYWVFAAAAVARSLARATVPGSPSGGATIDRSDD